MSGGGYYTGPKTVQKCHDNSLTISFSIPHKKFKIFYCMYVKMHIKYLPDDFHLLE